MNLSRLATVSTDGVSSVDRRQPTVARNSLGKILLTALWGGEAARAQYENHLPPAARLEWDALAAESDPFLFFENLLALSQRLQGSHPEAAARIYAATAEFLAAYRGDLKIYRDKFDTHLKAISGNGDFGPRTEFLLSKFIQEATDPAALFAMGLGTQAFRWGRTWAALRLGGNGLASRAAANGAGFCLEISAFTLGHKAAAATLGRPQDFGAKALARDGVSNALFLGPLKAMGGATRFAVGRTLGQPRVAALTQELGVHRLLAGLLPQAGMFAGILIGQELQQGLGLHERQDAPTRVADALATLLQLSAGNGLFSAALGAGFRRGQAEAEGMYRQWRDKAAAPEAARQGIFGAYAAAERPTVPNLRPAYEGTRPLRHDPTGPLVLMMAGEGPGGPKYRWTEADFVNLGKFRAGLNLIEANAIAGTIHPDQRHMLLFSRLLQNVTFPDRDARTLAFSRLGHIMRHSNMGGEAGGYVNWLTRKVFDSYLETQDIPSAKALLDFLVEGGRLRDYEKLLARSVPAARLSIVPPWVLESQRTKFPHYERIRQLHIPEEAKRILFRWVYTQAKAKHPEPHFISEDQMLDRIGQSLFFPGYGDILGKVLQAAEASPLPFYRLQRLHHLLGKTDHLTTYKLLELADQDFQLVGRKTPKLPAPFFFKKRPSQFNGYLGAEAPLELLEELQHRQADLLDPQKAEARKAARVRALGILDVGRGFNDIHSPLYWAYAFKVLGDPYAKRIAADIEAGKFQLEVLEYEDFARRCREIGEEDSVGDNAFFLHSGVTGDKPLMMVKAFPVDNYSFETRPDPVFAVMGKIAHEYQHFLDIDPAQPRTQTVVHLQEMRAHFREALWRAQYGDTQKLASFHRDGNTGLALHWRDKFESHYGHHFRRD